MTEESNLTQKEREIEMAWEQHKQEQTATVSKDELFKMRENGDI